MAPLRYFPGGHAVQLASEVEQEALVTWPGGHVAQAADPVALANEPRGQGKQGKQGKQDALDALESERCCVLYVPSGQCEQLSSEEVPRADDQVPGGQSSQVSAAPPAELANVPASHCWQSISEMEPLPGVVNPAGHGVHSAAEPKPVDAPNVPMGQGGQSDMAGVGCGSNGAVGAGETGVFAEPARSGIEGAGWTVGARVRHGGSTC